MAHEAVNVDCSITIVTDPAHLPLTGDDLARVIAEAINREYRRVCDDSQVVEVSIGDDVAWQQDGFE
jgi:hypothetical protein